MASVGALASGYLEFDVSRCDPYPVGEALGPQLVDEVDEGPAGTDRRELPRVADEDDPFDPGKESRVAASISSVSIEASSMTTNA
ncbi:hypothetical protein ACIQRK_29265 [Streptomyces anulatus]